MRERHPAMKTSFIAAMILKGEYSCAVCAYDWVKIASNQCQGCWYGAVAWHSTEMAKKINYPSATKIEYIYL
jgi:hypothetical protein